uniref:ATPase H+ transporting accessory protein 1a n=1 Tax=Neogobius melanostomus TaxID=47308 RepID=A0A8C6SHY6_9GOBI
LAPVSFILLSKMAPARTPHLRRIPLHFSLFLALLHIFHLCHGEEQVPLILWTSEGQSAPPAGHIVEQQQLSSYLEKVLNVGPKNVVLFLQDKMSIEDFTMYGGAFGNKQDSVYPNLESALRSSSSVLVLPSVSWPSSNAVLAQIQDHLETSPLYMDPETLSQLRLNASSPALLVFRLSYADLLSAKDILSENDEVIGQVMSIMKTQAVPFTAVYTALRPSRVSTTALFTLGLLRLIEGEKTCILLWAKGLSVSILRSGRWEEHDLTPSTFGEGVSPKLHGSSCDRSRARYLILSLCFYSFGMSQRHYKVSARRWFTLDVVELEYDGTKATFNGSRHIYAPAEYSYRCESVTNYRWPLLVPRSSKDPANQWRVSFQDIQIQAFNVSGRDFSYASDCAGFFSPGIWMGLMTSLLMVLVLTYGVHMIMQLRTMDRFDDPKGPAISVPQTE